MKVKKSNTREADEPVTHIRLLAPVTSNSELLFRQSRAEGIHLFSFAPEIDTLAKGNRGGRSMDKNDIYRIAWDNDWYSQNFRQKEGSFSGRVKLYTNFLLTGTPNQVRSYYGNVENGMATRISLAEIRNQEFAAMPKFRKITPEQRENINAILQRLQNMTFEDESEWKIKPTFSLDEKIAFFIPAIEKWSEEKRKTAFANKDLGLDKAYRRAAVKAFRAAMICCCIYEYLCPEREKIITDFCLWIAEMDVFEHLHFFGKDYKKLSQGNEPTKYSALYRELGDEFTTEDLEAAKEAASIRSENKKIIFRWTQSGMIEKTGENKWKKIKSNGAS